jgi:hypothetical protein
MHLMRRGKATAGQYRVGGCLSQRARRSGIARSAEAELVLAPSAAEKSVRNAFEQCVTFDLELHLISLPAIG